MNNTRIIESLLEVFRLFRYYRKFNFWFFCVFDIIFVSLFITVLEKWWSALIIQFCCWVACEENEFWFCFVIYGEFNFLLFLFFQHYISTHELVHFIIVLWKWWIEFIIQFCCWFVCEENDSDFYSNEFSFFSFRWSCYCLNFEDN